MKNTKEVRLATVAFFVSLTSLGLFFIMLTLLALSNSAALAHLRGMTSSTPNAMISSPVLWTILSSALWLALMIGGYLHWRKTGQADA